MCVEYEIVNVDTIVILCRGSYKVQMPVNYI